MVFLLFYWSKNR